MKIKIDEIEDKAEMKALFKTFDKLKKDALKLVADSKNEAHALQRATAVNEKLQSALDFSSRVHSLMGRRKCPDGTTYDPITDTCV